MTGTAVHRGRLVGLALAGAWRASPPPLALSRTALATVTPLLLQTGGAGVGWWRVRSSPLRTSRPASQLRQVYRMQSALAVLHEEQVKEAVTLLRAAGVEPLLAKGWAVGRLYPEAGLRPYGDIDLCVRPEDRQAAETVLWRPGARGYPVDVHTAFAGLEDRTSDNLFARSRLERLGEVEVRTLGPEDHLRFLCVHMLGHGACRPLWLCDIAAALEARPADFDWECCLGGDARRSEWVACALDLAHELLGARLDGTPLDDRASRLPRWLVPAVLRGWGQGYKQRDPIVNYLRHPAGLLGALRGCWPNPILATVEVGGPFNDLPRLPFQIAQCVSRGAQIVAELAGALRRQP